LKIWKEIITPLLLKVDVLIVGDGKVNISNNIVGSKHKDSGSTLHSTNNKLKAQNPGPSSSNFKKSKVP